MVGTTLDVYNALQLQDVRDDARRSSAIMELGQRADYVQRTTGVKPESWYEYKLKNAEPLELKPLRKALVGALVGVAIGAALLAATVFAVGLPITAAAAPILIAAPLSLGFLGALVGQNIEVKRENEAEQKLIKGYTSYLAGFEQAKSQSIAAAIDYRDDHVKRLKSSQANSIGQSR